MRTSDAVFEAWKQHQSGWLTRAGLARRLARERKELERALRREGKNEDRRAPAMAKDLLPQFACLWTFTRTDDTAPHSNRAERVFRPAVRWRKSSIGTQSRRGSRFVETILTVSLTLRPQGRGVLDFVERSIRAARRGKPAANLLSP